ncbi:pseudouridine synthase [uncultured Polaribacter sp.]|uniref:pseudouridine synthase n=1 Tax=uncultured Polaribacter sp. TaxID=174711 RepID=UPI002614D34A|nr:pseudouridine synthase [uncultured Polaribacter sp.]
MNSNRNSSRGRQEGKKNTPLSRKRKPLDRKPPKKTTIKSTPTKTSDATSGIRLNKYIANSGICSRREADTYIEHGSVEVNGQLVTEMGYKVQPDDIVRFDGTSITPEQKKYVLLNKPKNYITTMDDDRGRKTVMELIANASKERIYPVGRLDRNTTGLLLFTNDGDLAKKLTHPKHNVRKLYHASLDRKLELRDLEKLRGEVVIEGRKVFIDAVSYVNGEPKTEIGIEIHSGRNRIVRKIFEHVGYKVNKLDRVIFAELTKKNLPRGRWRELTNLEVSNLQKMK